MVSALDCQDSGLGPRGGRVVKHVTAKTVLRWPAETGFVVPNQCGPGVDPVSETCATRQFSEFPGK